MILVLYRKYAIKKGIVSARMLILCLLCQCHTMLDIGIEHLAEC